MSVLALVLVTTQLIIAIRMWSPPRRTTVTSDAELLTTHEVSRALGIPPAAVRSRIVGGSIPLARDRSGRVGIPLSYVTEAISFDPARLILDPSQPSTHPRRRLQVRDADNGLAIESGRGQRAS